MLRLPGLVSNILGFAIIAYAIIVLQAQILSELNWLNWEAILVGHAILLILTLPFTKKFIPTLLQTSCRDLFSLKLYFKKIFSENLELAILGLAVAVAMVLGAFLILIFPPNTTDSFLYHLSRVAYWLHHQNMHHFYVPNAAKIIYPINAEIGLFWLTALWGADLLAGFLQWTATILTMIAIYGISRRLDYSRTASLFAGLMWSTFTIVVAQSTSTKNDIVVTFWVMTTLYFLLLGLQQSRYKINLSLAGLAFGLAAGAKPLSFLALIGLGLMAGWLSLSRPRLFFPKIVYWAAWLLVGFIFLGAYNYILNWLDFDSFFGPQEIIAFHAVQNPSPASLVTNLIRIGYLLIDPTGLPAPVINFIQQWRPDFGAFIASAFNVDINMPGTSWGDAAFSFADERYFGSRDGVSWYGPLAILLLVPLIVHQLVITPFTKPNLWRWFVALSTVCYIITFALLFRWHPYIGRLLLIGITLSAPLIAGFFESFRNKPILRWLVVGLAVWILGWSATHNFHRPLLGADKIWQADYYDLRAIERPYMARAYRYLDQNIPPTAQLGIAGDWLLVTWDYLLFGPELKRSVTHLDPANLDRINLDTFVENSIDYLLVSSDTLDLVEIQVPFWPVTNVRTTWYLAKRDEAEIFSKTDKDPQFLEEAFGADYRAYAEIKTVLDQVTKPTIVLTTDPRMPFYDDDPRFEFDIPQELKDLLRYTYLIIPSWWDSSDYERLGLSETELHSFLAQEQFVKKLFETNGYTVYEILLSQN